MGCKTITCRRNLDVVEHSTFFAFSVHWLQNTFQEFTFLQLSLNKFDLLQFRQLCSLLIHPMFWGPSGAAIPFQPTGSCKNENIISQHYKNNFFLIWEQQIFCPSQLKFFVVRFFSLHNEYQTAIPLCKPCKYDFFHAERALGRIANIPSTF